MYSTYSTTGVPVTRVYNTIIVLYPQRNNMTTAVYKIKVKLSTK